MTGKALSTSPFSDPDGNLKAKTLPISQPAVSRTDWRILFGVSNRPTLMGFPCPVSSPRSSLSWAGPAGVAATFRVSTRSSEWGGQTTFHDIRKTIFTSKESSVSCLQCRELLVSRLLINKPEETTDSSQAPRSKGCLAPSSDPRAQECWEAPLCQGPMGSGLGGGPCGTLGAYVVV